MNDVKIMREICLTRAEIIKAHNAYEKECYGEDVMGKLEEMAGARELVLSNQDYENMSAAEMQIFEDKAVEYLDHYLSKKNDAYWEAFWDSVSLAVETVAQEFAGGQNE